MESLKFVNFIRVGLKSSFLVIVLGLGFRVFPGLVLSSDVQFFSACQGVNVVCSEAFPTSQVRNSCL